MSTVYTRTFKTYRKNLGVVKVEATLNFAGRGRFRLTNKDRWSDEQILEAFPELEEIPLFIALNGSDKDGVPLNAEEDAFNHILHKDIESLRQCLRISEMRARLFMDEEVPEAERIALANWEKQVSPYIRERLSTEGTLEGARRQAIDEFIGKLRHEWRTLALKAIDALKRPDYVDDSMDNILDPSADKGIKIDNDVLPCEVAYDNQIDAGPTRHYIIFKNSETAGKAAREYLAEMAENSPKEFTCMVGEETLIQWGLGRSAGPGSNQVSSLQAWLDLWLNTPEEHFASYDGKEVDCHITKALAEALEIEITEGVDKDGEETDKKDDIEWVPAVAYRY